MHDAPQHSKLLPENAYRKLNPGEVYHPIVPASDMRAEVTVWSVATAVALVAVFSAACIYIALRAGNGIEAAIPIAILAIFFGKLRKTRSTILENVIVQSIGQASGVVAAGAAFTIPAIYINGISPSTSQVFIVIFLACLVGGGLGTVLIIPLRKYFVAERHGDLPFPEATATTEILVAGESQGSSAGKILIISFLLGMSFDFLVEAVRLWNPELSSSVLLGSFGDALYDKYRLNLQINAIAALFGLGYIIGVRYAAIIAAGSVLSTLVILPVVYLVGSQNPEMQFMGKTWDIGGMSSGAIFSNFVKPIGIGAIAISGFIGIIKMGKIILKSITLGFKSFSKKGGEDSSAAVPRTERDMKPGNVMLFQLGGAVLMALVFFGITATYGGEGGGYSVGQSLIFAVVGGLVGFALSFLFTPVAAEAIAIVGVNPVSGMTMITIIIACAAMVFAGLSGQAGIFIAVVIGCAVCTALSTSGALISDFKIGYWIGATPRNQQLWKFLGIAVAAATVAIIIPLMDSAYHFAIPLDPLDPNSPLTSNDKVLPAPQANMLAPIVNAMMTGGEQPYFLYGLGGFVALMLVMVGLPPLAFSLGMYLPMAINSAVLVGAVASWIIGKTGGSDEVRKSRSEQGILIASGLIAGAAIQGILTAVMRLEDVGYPITKISVGVQATVSAEGKLVEEAQHWFEGGLGQGLGFFMLLGLGFVCFLLARWGADHELADRKTAK
ncbi:MAG: oligopeptide transporter, OPT family [Pseudomonadota bacterium]